MDAVKALPDGSRILILAPLVRDRKGEYQAVFDDLRKQGYARVRVDKTIHDLSEEINLDKNKKHTIEVVVDRLVIGQSDSQSRIADSVETALKLGSGVVLVSIVDGEELLFSEHFACVHCGSASAKLPRGPSASTARTAPAPPAPAWASSWKSTPTWSSPIKTLSISQGAIHP